MRTALLAWDYPPSPSGLSTAAREIAESLAAKGTDVTVFTLDRTGTEATGGVTIVGCAIAPGSRLARMRLWGSAGHLAGPLAFRRAVLEAHAARPFDILEATNWYAPAAALAARAPMPLVTRASTPASLTLDAGSSLRDRLDGTTARRLERFQARRSAGHIANTAAHAARVAEVYGLALAGKPAAAIGLSLPPDMIARGVAAPYPPAEGDGVLRLLFVGRAERRKGFDLMMAALPGLAEKSLAGALPPFRLDLVGVPPEDLPTLPEIVRPFVSARGRMNNVALQALYAEAHGVLAPSRYESFGLVYQEALSFGRPLIALASDASARDLVGAAGLLAEGPSATALEDAMARLLGDAGLRQDLHHKARAAAGRFTRETLGTETLALYEAVLRERPR